MKHFENKSALGQTSARVQTTLYEMVDAIGAGVGVNNVGAIVDIMAELCDKQRLRTIRQGAPIRMRAPVEKYRAAVALPMGTT